MAITMGWGFKPPRLLMRERNTSQLPRLLCCVIEKETEGPSACGGL